MGKKFIKVICLLFLIIIESDTSADANEFSLHIAGYQVLQIDGSPDSHYALMTDGQLYHAHSDNYSFMGYENLGDIFNGETPGSNIVGYQALQISGVQDSHYVILANGDVYHAHSNNFSFSGFEYVGNIFGSESPVGYIVGYNVLQISGSPDSHYALLDNGQLYHAHSDNYSFIGYEQLGDIFNGESPVSDIVGYQTLQISGVQDSHYVILANGDVYHAHSNNFSFSGLEYVGYVFGQENPAGYIIGYQVLEVSDSPDSHYALLNNGDLHHAASDNYSFIGYEYMGDILNGVNINCPIAGYQALQIEYVQDSHYIILNFGDVYHAHSNNYSYSGFEYVGCLFGPYWPSVYADIKDVSLPKLFNLHQNLPNPFNPNTTIRFDLYDKSNVKLIIYDTSGKCIRHLMNRSLDRGLHEVGWDGRDDLGNLVMSGVYFCRLEASKSIDNIKMVLVR